jgi:hypothetical protein
MWLLRTYLALRRFIGIGTIDRITRSALTHFLNHSRPSGFINARETRHHRGIVDRH